MVLQILKVLVHQGRLLSPSLDQSLDQRPERHQFQNHFHVRALETLLRVLEVMS